MNILSRALVFQLIRAAASTSIAVKGEIHFDATKQQAEYLHESVRDIVGNLDIRGVHVDADSTSTRTVVKLADSISVEALGGNLISIINAFARPEVFVVKTAADLLKTAFNLLMGGQVIDILALLKEVRNTRYALLVEFSGADAQLFQTITDFTSMFGFQKDDLAKYCISIKSEHGKSVLRISDAVLLAVVNNVVGKTPSIILKPLQDLLRRIRDKMGRVSGLLQPAVPTCSITCPIVASDETSAEGLCSSVPKPNCVRLQHQQKDFKCKERTAAPSSGDLGQTSSPKADGANNGAKNDVNTGAKKDDKKDAEYDDKNDVKSGANAIHDNDSGGLPILWIVLGAIATVLLICCIIFSIYYFMKRNAKLPNTKTNGLPPASTSNFVTSHSVLNQSSSQSPHRRIQTRVRNSQAAAPKLGGATSVVRERSRNRPKAATLDPGSNSVSIGKNRNRTQQQSLKLPGSTDDKQKKRISLSKWLKS